MRKFFRFDPSASSISRDLHVIRAEILEYQLDYMNTLAAISIAVLMLVSFSDAEAIGVRVRIGQGGLADDRAPDGNLGGGQLALDLKPAELPLVLSLAAEYYKKSRDANHPYEIESLQAVRLLYRRQLPVSWSSDVFVGGGIDLLKVPRLESEGGGTVRAIGFDAACGMSARLFWKIGIYIEGKYIYSKKTDKGDRVVDFGDFGALLGLSLDFNWWNL